MTVTGSSLDPDRRSAFIEFILECDALRFGEFTLKSGRRSPYFFNAGAFEDGRSMGRLGAFYAEALIAAGLEFDVLFGPAYKGIPLAVATGIALAQDHGRNSGIAFNRKEAKDHGEGGRLVGASLQGRIVLVDDVITAGTAVREVLPLIEAAGGELVGIITALDRQERGQTGQSAVEELATTLDVPVLSIVDLDDLVTWLGAAATGMEPELLASVEAYRREYGASSRER